jgi:hypothetical protein
MHLHRFAGRADVSPVATSESFPAIMACLRATKPREPLVPLTTRCRRYHVASTFLLFVFLMLPAASASNPGPAPASAALTASVSDTPDGVRLRIQASGDVEPGSVEVRFAGRKAVVLARDADGRAIRSQPLRLPARVVEDGSSADYDAEGALVITLLKQGTAQDAGPTDDADAAAR